MQLPPEIIGLAIHQSRPGRWSNPRRALAARAAVTPYEEVRLSSNLAIGALLLGLATYGCTLVGTLSFILAPIGAVCTILVGIGALEERTDPRTVMSVAAAVALSAIGMLAVLRV